MAIQLADPNIISAREYYKRASYTRASYTRALAKYIYET